MSLFELPYWIISSIRNWLYDRNLLVQYQSKLPIICVGNLSAGGNGKTPLVLQIAQLLKVQGRNPVILSRGYGGSCRGPRNITGHDPASLVGDEPLLLLHRSGCPVVISRKRAEGAKLIEQKLLGDIIILDDGFQHRALNRDLDIICAYVGTDDSFHSFKSGALLPVGRFRETKKSGLKRTNAIIFNSRSLDALSEKTIHELKEQLPPNLKVFSSHLLIDQICSREGIFLEKGLPQLVDAFCGLAQPEAFFKSIESFGVKIKNKYCYKDHSGYSESEIAKIIKNSEGRAVLCSEKDAVKLDFDVAKSVFVVKTSLIVEPKKEFLELISQAC